MYDKKNTILLYAIFTIGALCLFCFYRHFTAKPEYPREGNTCKIVDSQIITEQQQEAFRKSLSIQKRVEDARGELNNARATTTKLREEATNSERAIDRAIEYAKKNERILQDILEERED